MLIICFSTLHTERLKVRQNVKICEMLIIIPLILVQADF